MSQRRARGRGAVRLALFGGSFDPPHRAHVAIALAAADRFQLDRVLMAPTGRQPLKRAGAEASFAARMAMVKLACRADARLVASDVDAPHADGSANYTVDVLQAIHRDYPAAEVFAILGADGLPEMPRWRDAERLFALATWIAVSRPGHDLSGPLPAMLQDQLIAGRLQLIRDVALPVSSTMVRDSFHARGETADGLLQLEVRRYIEEHGLYRGGADAGAGDAGHRLKVGPQDA